jgi:hypothetical protein
MKTPLSKQSFVARKDREIQRGGDRAVSISQISATVSGTRPEREVMVVDRNRIVEEGRLECESGGVGVGDDGVERRGSCGVDVYDGRLYNRWKGVDRSSRTAEYRAKAGRRA